MTPSSILGIKHLSKKLAVLAEVDYYKVVAKNR